MLGLPTIPTELSSNDGLVSLHEMVSLCFHLLEAVFDHNLINTVSSEVGNMSGREDLQIVFLLNDTNGELICT